MLDITATEPEVFQQVLQSKQILIISGQRYSFLVLELERGQGKAQGVCTFHPFVIC